MNFNLHFGELHINNSINDKNNLFENCIPTCYTVKRILISFNCFSEYMTPNFVVGINVSMPIYCHIGLGMPYLHIFVEGIVALLGAMTD